MKIINFLASSVIIAHRNVLTLRIRKTHSPISSFNVWEIEWQ